MPKRISRRKARARANEAAVVATTKNRKERELWKCRGCGKRGKPKGGFPLFPRAPWKSRRRQARFPHSTAPATRRMGKWKTKSRFSTFPPPRILFLEKQKTRSAGRGFALARRRRSTPPK